MLGEVLNRVLLVVELVVHQRVVVTANASKETRVTSHLRPPAGLIHSLGLVAAHRSVPFGGLEHLGLLDGGGLLGLLLERAG